MSYARSLGAETPEDASLPTDVSPTLVQELAPIARHRGWVAIPTYDVREYVKAQLITAAAGFFVGVSVGAILGNVFTKKKHRSTPNLRRNGKRRTTGRRRKRGRPTVQSLTDRLLVHMDGRPVWVDVERGIVTARDRRHGSLYDFGTFFRAVPSNANKPVREFENVGAAVKYLIRSSEAA